MNSNPDDDDLTSEDLVDVVQKESEVEQFFSDSASAHVDQMEQALRPVQSEKEPTIH